MATKKRAPAKPAKAAPAKPAKVSKKAVDQLVSGLTYIDDDDDALATLVGYVSSEQNAAAVVAAALSHLKGVAKRFARAWLDVAAGKRDTSTIVGFVEQCAQPGVQWGAWLDAFRALLPGVTAGKASLAAARAILARDPLLKSMHEAAAAACEALGDARGAHEHASQAAALQRIWDVMLDLWIPTGRAEAKAMKAFAKLDAKDAALMIRRAGVRAGLFHPKIARMGLDALLLDDTMAPRVLAWSVATLRYHNDDEKMLDGWRARVVAGDERAIKRVLAVAREAIEIGALTHDVWEVLLRVLAPAAGRDDVFALVDAAFGKDNKQKEPLALQTALLDTWFQRFDEDEGGFAYPYLSNAQMDRVARVLLAKARDDKFEEQNEASNRVFYIEHVGAERAIVEALSARNDDDMYMNLYQALANISKQSASARRALVERLETEKDKDGGYNLLSALSVDGYSDELHAVALAFLDETRSFTHAARYAEAFSVFDDDHRRPEVVVDVVRKLLGWPRDGASALDLRRLKLTLIEGAAAALEQRDDALAAEAWRAAEGIKGKPKSDFLDDTEQDWEDPFADAKRKKRLDSALAGKQSTPRAAAAEVAAAIQAADEMNGRVARHDDDTLGALAGVTLKERFLEDQRTGAVWFVDTRGAMHIFDGTRMATARCEARLAERMEAFLDGRAGKKVVPYDGDGGDGCISERAMAWAGGGAREFREAIRLRDRVLVLWGVNNGAREIVGLAFDDEERAAAALATFRRALPKGFKETSPWYLPGRGAVMRTYHGDKVDRLSDGEWRERRCFGVVGRRFTEGGDDFASEEAAVAALQAYEARVLAAGGIIGSVEWTDRCKRDDDMTLLEWMKERIREDDKDAVWHLKALGDVARALRDADLYPRGLEIHAGPPCSDDDIERYQATVPEPLPAVLVDAWKRFGPARWTFGGASRAFLHPDDVLGKRARVRDAVAAALKPKTSEHARQRLAEVDALVVDENDSAITVLDVRAGGDDDRNMSHFDAGRLDALWWEKSLSWLLATQLLSDLVDVVAREAPDVALVRYGQKRSASAVRKRFEQHGKAAKFWEIVLDEATVGVRWGKLGTTGQVSQTTHDDVGKAQAAFDKAVAAKKKEGYVEAA